MTRILLACVLAGLAVPLHAQDTATAAVQTYRTTGSRVAVGRSVHVQRDEEVRDAVVVVGASVTVDGRVRNGIVAIGGDVHLGSTADVRGDVVLAGGTLTRDDGARLLGSVSTLSFGDWSRRVGVFHWLPTLRTDEFGGWLRLFGTTGRLSLLAIVAAILLVLARTRVARIGRAAAAAPVRAGVIGITVAVLFVPLLLVASLALGITIIGLPFVLLLAPIAVLLALLAMLLGFTALACRIGEWVGDRVRWRTNSAWLATAIGLCVILAPTIVARLLAVGPGPFEATALALLAMGIVVECAVWSVGLGATLMTGFGRWNTTPPPLDVVPHAAPAQPVAL